MVPNNTPNGTGTGNHPLNLDPVPVTVGSVAQLRKCTGYEDGTVLPASASRTYQEHDVLSALQRTLDANEVVRRIHRLLVDFQDHVATVQADIIGKRTAAYILHNHAFARWDIQPVGKIRGKRPHGQPEVTFLGLLLLVALLVFAQARCEELGAIGDGDSRFFFLSITHEADSGLAVRLAACDVGHQFVAVLDLFSVDRGNGVAHFQAGGIRGTPLYDVGNCYTRLHAIHTRDCGNRLRRELHADRASGYAVFRPDELVVDVDQCV